MAPIPHFHTRTLPHHPNQDHPYHHIHTLPWHHHLHHKTAYLQQDLPIIILPCVLITTIVTMVCPRTVQATTPTITLIPVWVEGLLPQLISLSYQHQPRHPQHQRHPDSKMLPGQTKSKDLMATSIATTTTITAATIIITITTITVAIMPYGGIATGQDQGLIGEKGCGMVLLSRR